MAIARNWTLRQMRLVHRRLQERQNREHAGRVMDVNAAFSRDGAEARVKKLTGD